MSERAVSERTRSTSLLPQVDLIIAINQRLPQLQSLVPIHDAVEALLRRQMDMNRDALKRAVCDFVESVDCPLMAQDIALPPGNTETFRSSYPGQCMDNLLLGAKEYMCVPLRFIHVVIQC